MRTRTRMAAATVLPSTMPQVARQARGVAIWRVFAAAVTGAIAVVGQAGPASAAKPVLVERVVFDSSVTAVDAFLSNACGTEVTASQAGHFTLKEYYDREGNLLREVSHPSVRET